jgi:uncharacterized protein (DUF1499 family)
MAWIRVGRRSALLACLLLGACTGTRPTNLGVHSSALLPCPASPNCVSSDSGDSRHGIAAFELAAPAAEAWAAARAAVAALPRTQLAVERSDYLHAECASRVFHFVDDLELQLRAERGVIAVRSASRLGYGDLGVNRRRLERLRAALVERGVVRRERREIP